MHPVITDMKKAEAVLAWAVDKMEERYDLLARVGVRHLDNYNKMGKAKVLERLGMMKPIRMRPPFLNDAVHRDYRRRNGRYDDDVGQGR